MCSGSVDERTGVRLPQMVFPMLELPPVGLDYTGDNPVKEI